MPLETEPPELPAGEVMLYHLTGEWGLSEERLSLGSRPLPRFRDVPMLSSILLTPDLATSLRQTLGRHRTYEGEPMRCFIPRHGLRFGGEGGVDALSCLECHLAYFWVGGTLYHYALSETAVPVLSNHFLSPPSQHPG